MSLTPWEQCQSAFAMRLCGQSPASAEVTPEIQSIVDQVYWSEDDRAIAIQSGFNATHRHDEKLFAKLRKAFDGRR